MKKLLLVAVLALCSVGEYAYAGNCDYSWQTAADGSSCGDRAASIRPGGYEPPPHPRGW